MDGQTQSDGESEPKTDGLYLLQVWFALVGQLLAAARIVKL